MKNKTHNSRPTTKRLTFILAVLSLCVWLYSYLKAWQRDTFYQCTMRGAGDYVPRWYV